MTVGDAGGGAGLLDVGGKVERPGPGGAGGAWGGGRLRDWRNEVPHHQSEEGIVRLSARRARAVVGSGWGGRVGL